MLCQGHDGLRVSLRRVFSNALKHEEPKFPRQLGLPRSWGGPVIDNLSIRDLLLLTCMGTFIACATYAVTLLP
jgi:hypothetical protein